MVELFQTKLNFHNDMCIYIALLIFKGMSSILFLSYLLHLLMHT